MDCSEFRHHFTDYVDGALTAADAARYRRHLTSCEGCRRLAAAYRKGIRTLRGLAPLHPARDLSARILHRARREPRVAILVGGYGLAGALLLATFFTVVAVDVREHRGVSAASTWVADDAARPGPGPELVTFQVHEPPPYGSPVTPYAVVPAGGGIPASRYQFEVPAAWSGR